MIGPESHHYSSESRIYPKPISHSLFRLNSLRVRGIAQQREAYP
jgi:hypothetical protein